MTPEFRISIETAVFHITMFWALQTNRRHDPTLCCLYKEDPLGEDAKILHPQPQLLHTPFIWSTSIWHQPTAPVKKLARMPRSIFNVLTSLIEHCTHAAHAAHPELAALAPRESVIALNARTRLIPRRCASAVWLITTSCWRRTASATAKAKLTRADVLLATSLAHALKLWRQYVRHTKFEAPELSCNIHIYHVLISLSPSILIRPHNDIKKWIVLKFSEIISVT